MSGSGVVAASTGTFYGQAMTTGHIYTVAGDGTAGFGGDGGPATSAELHWPFDVTVDGAGNLILADADNNRIRVVAAKTGTFYGVPMTAGNIYTVAGTGIFGFTGDGGPASPRRPRLPHRRGGGRQRPADRRQQPGPDDLWLTWGSRRRAPRRARGQPRRQSRVK